MNPVVKPGEVWESRDTRDLQRGPSGSPRRVRVIRVHDGMVHMVNVMTGRQTHAQLAVFASRQMRGGFRKVQEAPATYRYRVIDAEGVLFEVPEGTRLQRRGPLSSDKWENVDG